jgi:hypothetical protein
MSAQFTLARRTPEWAVRRRLDRSPLDFERLTLDERLGNLAARDFDDPSERRAGNPHPFRSLILVEPLEVSQSDGLELIESHHHHFESTRRNSRRHEYRRSRCSRYATAAWWPGHRQTLHINYKHMLITVKGRQSGF